MPRLSDLHGAFLEWLALPTPEIVDVTCATILANRMEGDPLWTFIVGPPGSGKTEVIRTADDVSDCYPLSALTPNTFASGFEKRGVETSLLPKIDGKTLLLKDFGTVLSQRWEKKAEILGQLREIYDGAFRKDFGNGKSFQWAGKVGLLAGVTAIVDRELQLHAILGERFLLYRVKSPLAREVARRAMGQRQREADQRRRLRRLVADFLETVPLDPPAIPPAFAEALAALAEFTAVARSPILFDTRGEIDLIPAPESPGRLAKQFALLAQALAIVRGQDVVRADSYCTVLQVAQDTVPAQRKVMIEALLMPERFSPASTTEVAEVTKYPTSTIRRYLQELTALGLVDRLTEGQGHTDHWCASASLTDLLDAIRLPVGPETSSVKTERVM